MTDLSVVIPCYNENEEIVTTLYTELTAQGIEVIVVDDGDTMDLSFPHVSHSPNMGYGYAIKRGINNTTRDIICVIDGDAQHLVSDVVKLYQVYKLIDDCKMVVGARWNLKEQPLRWVARKFLNFIASLIANHYLIDLNSGMRIFDRKTVENYFPILCDTFSFTTSLSMAMVTDKHKMAYFPINVQPRAYGKSRVRLFQDGLVTLYYIVWVGLALRTRGVRSWIRKNPITRVLLGIGLIIYGIIGIFIPGVPGDALCLSGLICISPNLANWCVSFYKKHPKLVWFYAIVSTLLGIFVFPYIGYKWIRHISGR